MSSSFASELLAEVLEPVTVFAPVLGEDGSLVDLEFLYANQAACAYNGTTLEQVVGQRMLHVFPAMADSSSMAAFREVLATGQTVTLQAQAYPSRRPDGQERHFDIRIGKVGENLYSAWLDVTEHVQALTAAQDGSRALAEAEQLAHLGSWVWDLRDKTISWSDEHYRIFGLDPQQPLPGTEGFGQFVHPEDRVRVTGLLKATEATGEPFRAEHRIVRPDGQVRWVRGQGAYLAATEGLPDRIVGVVVDITEEHELQRSLADSEELHRLLTENAYDVIWTMDLDGTITHVSPAVERVRGFTPEEARQQPLDQINPPESAARVSEYFAQLFAAIEAGTDLPIFRGEMEYYRKDGSIMQGELQVVPQVDGDGRVVRILGVTRDVSERRAFEEELRRLAATDPLTGVWNRRHGQQALEADLAASRRYGPPMSLLVLDVDHFKSVNDTHGHQAGDVVLTELCGRLSEKLRPSDMLARWGGEEFLILARHCDLEAGIALARKVHDLITSTPFEGVGTVTVSIGVTELRPDDDLDSWLDRADQALYDAKAAGRNAVRSRT